MAITDIERFSFLQPGRGKVYFGIVNYPLDSYVNGTGFVLTPADFKLSSLKFVQAQSVDCTGVLFDWDPSTSALKAYTANATEVANDGLNGKNALLMYWGFR